MNIDWKHLATTSGYQSLKAAYTEEVKEAEREKVRFNRRPRREKEEFLKLFNWVISRAKHYAHHKNIPIEIILNEWEEKRGYWWLNFYQECNQPKITPRALKQRGTLKQHRSKNKECKKIKKRWSSAQKRTRKNL